MGEPRNIRVGDAVFCVVNEIDTGPTVVIDAVAPDQRKVSISVLKDRASDLAVGAMLMAAWGQALSARRVPL